MTTPTSKADLAGRSRQYALLDYLGRAVGLSSIVRPELALMEVQLRD